MGETVHEGLIAQLEPQETVSSVGRSRIGQGRAESCLQSVDEGGGLRLERSFHQSAINFAEVGYNKGQNSVKETHIILILDRGFFSMDVFLLDKFCYSCYSICQLKMHIFM